MRGLPPPPPPPLLPPSCLSRPSRIVYSDKGAGIRDRLQVLEALSRLAAPLCALVAMDPPCRALKRGHNRGKELPCAWGWDRYVRISHAGTAMLNRTLPPAPALRVGSTDAAADLARVRAVRGGSFVWRFPYFHAAARQIRFPAARVEVAFARNLSRAAEEVAARLPRRFSTLHVRRRDTVGECDTAVARVVAYVNCSLPAASPLVFFTDDRSKEYLRPLASELLKLGVVSSVHHLDPLVQPYFPGDNYATFLTEMIIAKKAVRQLELRRASCPLCEPARRANRAASTERFVKRPMGAKRRGWRREACLLNATADDLPTEIRALPAYFLRHWPPKSVTFAEAQRTYESLAGWGRTRFQIVSGRLYYPNLKHNTFGCVLRRTPILAWALLELLERHPLLPDVDLAVNCRDKPGSVLGTMRKPLAFSYTTGRAFTDVPLPDYTYWGLPYAELPPWPAWMASMDDPQFEWESKVDKMIWVGSPTNPLRQAFFSCATAKFGERLVHRMPDKEAMHELAWRCKPSKPGEHCAVKPRGWTPLSEQCKYKYILHLPGISDWLEHFKHQLACGSVNIFIGTRPPRQRVAPRGQLLEAPTAFEHFDFSGPLLKEGKQFLFVPIVRGGVCRQLQATISRLETRPEQARCIARAGRELSRRLDMDAVYDYMAETLTQASARQQDDVARRVVQAEQSRLVTKQNYFAFVPPAKRPWMENIFVPWHRASFNSTPLLQPHGAETASGLFH
ncbi:hypothetical protein AB1Y20_021779 [Prymnesium parvum]|uniref:Glycosyl transferase CAP10 domain-containing protein n=1 Tax=Prymnesium parvum TaxID=97485 RepID=A0AB34JKP8_PRYPA